MPKRPKRKNLGTCRLDGCPAPIVKANMECIKEERMAPRFSDGTPNLFAPFEEGEVVLRVFRIDEYCEQGHVASCERHYFPESRSVYDTPYVFEEAPQMYDSEQGWSYLFD